MQTVRSQPAAEPSSAQGVPRGQGTGGGLLRYGEYALAGLTVLSIMLAIWVGLVVAPTDTLLGEIQRITYFHVGVAWVAFLAFFVVFVASIVYLWRRDERWDWVARSAAEVGTVYTTLVLITGSIYGKAAWGTWWTGEPKLVTTLILWFIYAGYLLLRYYTGRTATGARNAAVLGIVGMIDVPLVQFAATWLHPAGYIANSAAASGTPASVMWAVLLAVVAFTLLFAYLMRVLYRLERLQTEAERLRARVEYGAGD